MVTNGSVSKHSPNGGATHHFDEVRISGLIQDWQRSRDTGTLGTIIELCRPNTLSLIRARNTVVFEEESELCALADIKLIKSLARFRPEKGPAFTYISWLTTNSLANSVNRVRKHAARHTHLEPPILNELPDKKGSDHELLETIKHAITQIKSAVTDPGEREAQKWMLASLDDVDFSLKRAECGDVAMEFGIPYNRSRFLYDLTMVALRRILFDELSTKRATHISERDRPMLRFQPFLTPAEMVKLLCLLRNLGWLKLVQQACPANAWAIVKLNDHAKVRANLLLILEGDPKATPLYT